MTQIIALAAFCEIARLLSTRIVYDITDIGICVEFDDGGIYAASYIVAITSKALG